MYCGEEAANNSSSALDKETLQLSPHIAAHKSSTSVVNIPFVNENLPGDGQLQSRLIALPSNALYKLNACGATGHVELPYSIRSSDDIVQIVTRALPEDLSAAPPCSKTGAVFATNKTLPAIQPGHQQAISIGQAIDSFTGSLVVSDRAPTLYSFVDGATVTISGQHSTVYLSPVNGDNGGCEIYRARSDGGSASNLDGSTAQDMTMIPMQPGLHDGQLIVPDLISGQIIWDEQDIKKMIKNEDDLEKKDLVRQALQAAVSHNSPRMGSEDLLGNDYGSNECLSEDRICHSTFSVQNKPQEVVMMSGHLGSVASTPKYIGSMSTLLPAEITNGTQVLVLQAATVPEGASLVMDSLQQQRCGSHRPKDTALLPPRKKNVANRMKEKRASENDDQRKRRRSREAERMRRKRLQEDDGTKQRRRYEAAERARKRRANLSPDERDVERKKAAHRMRLRRLKENEDERKVRRDKAAERMRLRRSKETPEEKALRRQGLAALRVKQGKLKRDSESPLSGDDADEKEFVKTEVYIPHHEEFMPRRGEDEYVPEVEEEYIAHDNEEEYIEHQHSRRKENGDPLALPDAHYGSPRDSPAAHKIVDGRPKHAFQGAHKMALHDDDHIMLNSALTTDSANFTLVSNDVLHNDGRFIHVPMSDFSDVIPVEVRTLDQVETRRIPSMSASPPQQMAINKRIVTQAPPSYSEAVSPALVTEGQLEPLSLQKASGAQLGIHHLPHILHHQHIANYPPEHIYHPDQHPTGPHSKNH